MCVCVSILTSASLQDMNLSTTCLRYSKLISRESFRSDVLITVVPDPDPEVGPGPGTGDGALAEAEAEASVLSLSICLSCLSPRPSWALSLLSVSVSGFSFYRGKHSGKRVHVDDVMA